MMTIGKVNEVSWRLARVTSAKKARSLPGSFFAGAGFDAAGYIHGVGADGANGFGRYFPA